jgi:hypothetical protein
MIRRTLDITHFRSMLPATIVGVLVIAYFVANVEIQIEGAGGWAANLPTWRIAPNWMLDLFWGGREMTGYHAWMFPCIALFFHFPLVFNGYWSWRMEARVIGCILMFWIVEDFLWFALNPAFGLAHFSRENIPWHVHWLAGAPSDYWVFLSVATIMFSLSCVAPRGYESPDAPSRKKDNDHD